MTNQKVLLDGSNPDIFLECYIADPTKDFVRDAMLVIPGGGYYDVCADREGEPIALAFLGRGMNAFVLHYSVKEKAKFPQPLLEASKAVKYIRDHAKEFQTNPDRIFACGFSAGGHLCAALGTLWHKPEIYEAAGLSYGENKIAGMLPIYPVISGILPGTHMGSFQNLLGSQSPTREELERYSLERCVDEHTVPAFLVHTAEDQAVGADNSLVFAQALIRCKIPCELHLYPKGPHGIALANRITWGGNPGYLLPNAEKWVDQAMEWMGQLS